MGVPRLNFKKMTPAVPALSEAQLLALGTRAFEGLGLPHEDAQQVARILVTADLFGLSTHGLSRIESYGDRLKLGGINARPRIQVEQVAPAMCKVDGDNAVGPLVGMAALKAAMQCASQCGVGVALARSSNHFGPISPYSLMAAEAGFASIIGSNATTTIAPWGGSDARLGNSPIGFGVPCPGGDPFLLDMAMSVVARAKIDVLKTNRLPSAAAFEDAANSADPICLLPTEGRVFAALLRMPAYDDAVLMVQREVSQLAIEFPGVSRAAAAEYLTYDSLRRSIQITFASVFLLIALIALLSAVWFGMNFANRFVAPIRRLINAADQVASGNFYAQVPTKKTSGDLAHLGESFNKMTQELRRQHAGLIAASDLIDTRRRFIEAVLSGASAGVIGVDAGGRIRILNRSAERLIGRTESEAIGQPLIEVVVQVRGHRGQFLGDVVDPLLEARVAGRVGRLGGDEQQARVIAALAKWPRKTVR